MLKYHTERRALSARREARQFIAYVAPAMLLIIAFVGIPFFMCIFYSFQKWNGIAKASTFTGLDNYIRLFTSDTGFSRAFGYTFVYAAGVVALVNVLSLLLAAMLEGNVRGKGFFRAAFYIPNIISMIIIGFIWKFICIRVFEGLSAATNLGVFRLSWLGDPALAVATTILVSVWQNLGFYLVIYIAGIQSVPGDLPEAAMIDGAGAVRRFFQITLPMIMPSISFCMFHSVASSMKLFELIFSLTGGGPGTATTVSYTHLGSRRRCS